MLMLKRKKGNMTVLQKWCLGQKFLDWLLVNFLEEMKGWNSQVTVIFSLCEHAKGAPVKWKKAS